MSMGAISLVPVILVIALVLVTRKTPECLVIGSIVGSIILWKQNFIPHFAGLVWHLVTSYMFLWIVFVCAVLGCLVKLFQESGGVYGFSEIAGRVCTDKRRAGIFSWVLSIILFIDDWLAMLTLGAAVTDTTDKLGISREKMTVIACSAATSICVMIPISTWGIFMVSQLVSIGLCEKSEGISTFFRVLPYMYYPIICLLFGLLYAMNLVPEWGPIRKTQPVMPDENSTKVTGKAFNLLVPVAVMIVFTILGRDVLYGVCACMVVCAIMYTRQKLMTLKEFLKYSWDGLKSMDTVIKIIFGAFLLRDVNNELGMPDYVIHKATDVVAPEYLPLTAFTIVMVLAIMAGNFWGICAISFPVIMPIAIAFNANLLLVAGAIISGTTAGSHLCFYGAEVTIACKAMGIENTQYLRTGMPMMLIPIGITMLLYLFI